MEMDALPPKKLRFPYLTYFGDEGKPTNSQMSNFFGLTEIIRTVSKGEKVTTTKITTSKSKKNIQKFVNHHYIESLH